MPKRTKRILPRLSTATGGPKPGIAVSDSAALQEIDDLEYVERLKGEYTLSDDERKCVEEGLEQVRRGEYVSDNEMSAFWKRFRDG
jgi:hypothetical protein